MKTQIEIARNEFLQAKSGISHALAMTPDDRLNWSPAPTARSPLHQVVHAAASIGHITAMLGGYPYPAPTTAQADLNFREFEGPFATREAASEFLEEKSDAFLTVLDAMTPEAFESMIATPFGMGEVPMSLAITFPARHTQWHQAQLEYIQTLYGDLDWHIGR